MYCTVCGERLPEDVKVEQGLNAETNEMMRVLTHQCKGQQVTVWVSEGG